MNVPAVIFQAPGQVVVREVAVPPPGPGEIQIRTEFSVISAGTEGHCLRARFSWGPTPFPCVPGYQRAGTIQALGEGVNGLAPGDRVVATIAPFDPAVSGVSSQWGAHAAVANTSATQVFALPTDVDPLDAAGFVVAQVGWNAANRANLDAGDWVLVMGDGLIGQMAAQAARARGAKVILAGRRPDRLRLALMYSADAVVNVREENLTEAVKVITGLPRVGAVLDSIQGEEVQAEYLELLENGLGQIVYCGNSYENSWANLAWLQQRELTAHFVSGFTRERLQATLHLMGRGQMTLKPLLTHRVPFWRAPEMYGLILEPRSPFLGMVLDWTATEICR